MARKNISIGINTWNDLAALGRFGQTFDDIIRILLAEHEELKELKESKGTGPTQQTQQLQPKILQIDILLPGIEFPADKSEIIQRAEKAGTPTVINFLRSISDREYRNKSALENELLVRAKSSKSDFIRKGGNVIFKIDDKKLREEQYDEKRVEQENKLNELMGKIRIK